MKQALPVKRRSEPLTPLGRNYRGPTGPLSPRKARRAVQVLKAAPGQFRIAQKVLMPDVPEGVVLDGNVEHISSPRPTVRKKYRG